MYHAIKIIQPIRIQDKDKEDDHQGEVFSVKLQNSHISCYIKCIKISKENLFSEQPWLSYYFAKGIVMTLMTTEKEITP